jgi:Zn-dependent peptidase ImmA (M78 family)
VSFNKQESARLALKEAVRLRKITSHTIWDAICPYDCAEQIGLEIRFVDIPSLEGMYIKGNPPIVLVSSLRPMGRAAFTCAHEIGHHIFGHGTRIDQDQVAGINNINNQDEFLAQTFAGFFLMPKSAVDRAFTLRNWRIESCTPIRLYTIACWFGVGYETLIDHLQYSLKVLSADHAKYLKDAKLSQIKADLITQEIKTNLIVVDNYWTNRAIDIQLGDMVLLPKGVIQKGDKSKLLSIADRSGELFQGVLPGIGQFYNPSNGWSAFLRVSKPGFIGRSIFRHLDDPDYD